MARVVAQLGDLLHWNHGEHAVETPARTAAADAPPCQIAERGRAWPLT
jgi:hypothetical protein